MIALGGIPNKTQVGSRPPNQSPLFPLDRLDGNRRVHLTRLPAGKLQLEEERSLIQVKQRDKVGRSDVDAFEAMMAREGYGTDLSSLSTTSSDAFSEIGYFLKRPGCVIVPLTVRNILGEQIAHKLA